MLWRDPTTLQIGIARPFLLENLSEDEARFVASLENSPAAITAADARHHRSVVDALDAHGLLVPTHVDQGVELSACVHGAGPLGMDIAAALIRDGMEQVSMVDSQPARTEAPQTYALSLPQASKGAAAAWTLRERFPSARVTSARRNPSVDVVVTVGAVSPPIAHELMVTSQPHVAVLCDEEGVTVSHVIVPGSTPCTRCDLLTTTARDPWWPRMMLQLGPERAPHVAPSVALLAAAIAARTIAQWSKGTAASPWRARINARISDGMGPEFTVALPHPECGCGAAQEDDSRQSQSRRTRRSGLTVIDGDG